MDMKISVYKGCCGRQGVKYDAYVCMCAYFACVHLCMYIHVRCTLTHVHCSVNIWA